MKSCKLLMDQKGYALVEVTLILDFIKAMDLPIEIRDKHVEGVLEDCKEIRVRGDKAQLRH